MGAVRILAGDSPGLQKPGDYSRLSGLGEAAKKSGAEWLDFTQEKIDVPCPEGKVTKKFTVTRAVREADVIINLPKLKNHQLMYFTGALKNTFGLIPSIAKSPFHARFSSRESFAAMIVDLNLAVKPAYALMDAVTGMEGPGPSAGTPRHIGLVLASSNLLAMDAAACAVIGYPAEAIPIHKDALGRSVWLSDFREIEYPGLSPADARISGFVKVPFKRSTSQFLDFILPGPLRALRESFAPRPVIRHDICVRCGDCVRICSPEAMSITGEEKERRVVIDYRNCIRCFCCHEICPAIAIDITKRSAAKRKP
jgi:uncharacterized protein (DUF362 family)/Pyruvate/2-oxoacid:ferredoxin oxidoreductase delta subunit